MKASMLFKRALLAILGVGVLIVAFLFIADRDEVDATTTSDPAPEGRRTLQRRTVDDQRDLYLSEHDRLVSIYGTLPMQSPKECKKMVAGHLKKVKKYLFECEAMQMSNIKYGDPNGPVVRETGYTKAEEVFDRFSANIGGMITNVMHSYHDDGEMIYIWFGNGDAPTHGYAARKKDEQTFCWALEGGDEDLFRKHIGPGVRWGGYFMVPEQLEMLNEIKRLGLDRDEAVIEELREKLKGTGYKLAPEEK